MWSAWAQMSRDQRAAAVNRLGRSLAQQLGRAPTMADWDAEKPADWPSGSGVAKVYASNRSWSTLAAQWAQSWTTGDTLSGA
jgi:hypothetical protein